MPTPEVHEPRAGAPLTNSHVPQHNAPEALNHGSTGFYTPTLAALEYPLTSIGFWLEVNFNMRYHSSSPTDK